MSETNRHFLAQTILAACSACHEGADLSAATAEIRRALLAFGSETPDNLSCAAQIEFGAGEVTARTSLHPTGLRLVGSNILLSDILNTAEDANMPEPVRAAFPDLSEDSWAAVMRMATLIVLSLECDR